MIKPFHVASRPSAIGVYADAELAGCQYTRKSATGVCLFLGYKLIRSAARAPQTVARSSAESEFFVQRSDVQDVSFQQTY
eukprot:11188318-Lingulodinium_polyedra.AAC.1